MAKTRVIILAAGSDARWQNYRGTSKHLIKIEGKTLLERTCSQFLKYTDDVCVIGADEGYKIDGTSLYVIKSDNTHWKDAAKFLSSQNLWLRDGRTVLVFGDVYFTSEAVKTIMKDKDPFKFFLRTGPSEISGAHQKEIFAVSFNETTKVKISQSLLYLVSMGQAEAQSQWSLYRYMIGAAPSGLFNNPHFTEIDDWTRDFDSPNDIDTFEERRKNSRAKKSS